MLSKFSKKLNQNELDAIEQANAIISNARTEMTELYTRLYNEDSKSSVIFEIINLSEAIIAADRASEMLLMFAKLLNETKNSSEND